MSTGSWKFIGLIIWFPHIIKTILSYFFKIKKIKNASLPEELYTDRMQNRSLLENIKKAIMDLKIFPKKYGKVGNPISEIYYFSYYRWKIIFYQKSSVFYSGYSLFRGWPRNRNIRKILSKILGSTTHIFLLKKQIFYLFIK